MRLRLKFDPIDIGLFGCAGALAVIAGCAAICAVAGTYAFVMWAFGG